MLLIDVDKAGADQLLDQIERRLDDSRTLLGFVVDDAQDYLTEVYATANFGQWAPLAADTRRRKGSSRILVDDGGMLADLTTDKGVSYSSDFAKIATDAEGAYWANRDSRRSPKRDPLPKPTQGRADAWAERLLRHVVGGLL